MIEPSHINQFFKMLGKIKSELDSISFMLLIIAIVGMTSCSNLGDIARELKGIKGRLESPK